MSAALWTELHLHALTHTGTEDIKYLRDFSYRVPKYTAYCKCKEHWAIWMKTHPPKFGPGEYFAWTVDAHNDVSKRLGKPEMSLEEAKTLYTAMLVPETTPASSVSDQVPVPTPVPATYKSPLVDLFHTKP